MAKNTDKNWLQQEGHPPDDDLLLYLDGELSTKDAGDVRTHLEACWSCRVRLEKVQEAISDFIDYRNQILKPSIEPPPHGWRGFDDLLSQQVAETGKRSFFSAVRESLGRIFSTARLMRAHPPVMLVRITAGLFAALLLSLLIFYFNRVPTVSADELLNRAVQVHSQQLRTTPQAVIYQKVQLKRKKAGSSTDSTVTWEVWSDTSASRSRQAVDTAAGRRFVPNVLSQVAAAADQPGKTGIPADLTSLARVLEANNMDPQLPLSAVSYNAWRGSVSSKHEAVTASTRAGVELMTLETTSTGPSAVGAVTQASLVVRAHDWHPVAERLRVKQHDGDDEYELTETAFEVISVSLLDPAIFADESPVGAPEIARADRPTEESASITAPARVAASTELEIEVLSLLSQAGADLGEQVSVTRAPDGSLRVEGVVETDERKRAILETLSPARSSPAVQIEISTVAEATQPETQRSEPTSPLISSHVEVTNRTLPVEPDLRQYFSQQGGDVDDQIRQFASRALAQSQQALFHASAMRRLAARFSLDQLRAIDPKARATWLAMIRNHASGFAQKTATLRSELEPVFYPEPSVTPSEYGFEITGDADLIWGIERLYALASSNDEVVRSAFTLTSGDPDITAIKTPQFLRSLLSAERLAAHIAMPRPEEVTPGPSPINLSVSAAPNFVPVFVAGRRALTERTPS